MGIQRSFFVRRKRYQGLSLLRFVLCQSTALAVLNFFIKDSSATFIPLKEELHRYSPTVSSRQLGHLFPVIIFSSYMAPVTFFWLCTGAGTHLSVHTLGIIIGSGQTLRIAIGNTSLTYSEDLDKEVDLAVDSNASDEYARLRLLGLAATIRIAKSISYKNVLKQRKRGFSPYIWWSFAVLYTRW